MTLKGQNFRVFAGSSVIGMATNCTVTLTGNTEDASNKDDVGLASKPTIVSKGWQVQVDSLDVTDTGAMLTAIKSMTPFTLKWDETSTSDNQTSLAAAYARTGQAYLTDATFNFNDRENAAKSIQFSGTGPLSKGVSTTTTVISSGTYTKGQFVRLFLSDNNSAAPAAVIAGAKSLAFHVSCSVENSTTKDTDGDWIVNEVTAINFDISTSALVRSNDTITSSVAAKSLSDIEDLYEGSLPVKFMIANTSGANQRTAGTTIVSGSVVFTSLTMNGPNRQNATYDAQMQGYGDYTVGS